MPENDFEKQVQQIFGDMRLKPSEAVWSKVQERVSREKKRRRILLWVPAALLLLGGGLYWAAIGTNGSVQNNKQQPGTVAGVNAEEQTGLNSTPLQPGEHEKNTPGSIPQNSPATVLPNENDKNTSEEKAVTANQTGLPAATAIKPATNKNLLHSNSGNNGGLNNNAGVEKNTGHAHSKAGINNKRNSNSQASENDIDDNTISPLSDNVITAAPVTGTYQYVEGYGGLKNIDGEKALNKFAGKNKPVIKLSKKKSWEWGVTAQAGVSTVGKGLSGVFKNGLFEKAETLDYAQNLSPSNSNNGFLGNQGIIVAAPPPPSSIKAGMAWNAGAFGKWHIKEKLALTFGAEYNLYTTNREVGNIVTQQYSNGAYADVNARFAAYYTGSEGVNYTNRYHFVQMPLGIQWQLNKGIKLPVHLDAGLTFAYLINTNAVHYRANTGVYYEDKSLFHRFQTGLYAGVSAKLFQHAQRPLYIGPLIQYNLSGLGKPSSGLKQNFMYAGLKAQWVLWKK